MAKRKVSKKKVFKLIAALLVVVVVLIGGFMFFGKDKPQKVTVKKSVDSIKGYDYTLSENATKYYKGLFKKLKNVLEADDVDEDKYAELVAKMFVADFYNLDNKVSKNDVGGVQFVYSGFTDDFKKLATSSMYKSVKSNIYGKRKQELPVVVNVSTEMKDSESFKYGDNTDDKAYMIDFNIEYASDLGYQESGVLTIIHNDKKLEVASLADADSN